ncbi:MAG: hypothetical protein KDD01_26855 [Phaeodactylibacter sp.]|nr:hypothetical protein [Phaeodactylibacter sp.]
MKFLRSLPSDTGFFETYAKLARSIKLSGIFAQVISAATEIGIIYALSYQALLPILPEVAPYLAGIVAALGTVTIEGGLRVTTPQAVDAVLYGRFGGLHLVMSIAVFIVVFLLGGASGVLSFKNSDTIVENLTAPSADREKLSTDSLYNGLQADAITQWKADSTTIAAKWQTLLTSQESAFSGRITAANTDLANIRRKEARTGRSYATQKDNAKAAIAALEADKAGKLADLQAGQAAELDNARADFRQRYAGYEAAHSEATGAIDTGQADKVAKYGGGLGYFTVVCLIIFFASVILDRVHHKGSGISETVEVSQYDVNPHWWTNLSDAIRDRWNYGLQSRITAFADRTPPPPLPKQPAQLYDPTQLANIQITLKVDQGEDDQDGVIYIQPKRRPIGFGHDEDSGGPRDLYSTRTEHETPDTREWKQRLKLYKKRLGSHTQKKIKLEIAGREVPARTLQAIENNQQWVKHYTDLINQATGRK